MKYTDLFLEEVRANTNSTIKAAKEMTERIKKATQFSRERVSNRNIY